jgi:uncharacterized delta-60 repeat protein
MDGATVMERFVRRRHTRAYAGARRLLGPVAAIALITSVAVTVGLAGRGGGTSEGAAGFGKAGKVRTDFGGDDIANALAIQGDGRIIAAGRKGRAFAVARYTRDGRLDRSFGTGGKLVTTFHLARAREAAARRGAAAVAIAGDGKIVAAGGSGADFALARYLSNGRLDRTFGRGGKVVTDVGSRPNRFELQYWQRGANALALQADGRIIAAGAGPGVFALVRYTEDGQLDPSFGSGGMVFTSFASSSFYVQAAQAVAVQADGKIVAAGATGTAGSSFALARYLPDGQLDPTFGSGGKVVAGGGGDDFSFAYALAIQPDGKIVAAGSTGPRFLGPVVVRYTPSGGLDASFGRGGIAGIGDANGASAVVLDRRGRIVLAGDANRGVYGRRSFHEEYYVAVVRYTPAGRLDATFGRRGTALTRFPLSHDLLVTAVARQRTGKIVAAGGSWRNRKLRHDFLLVRYRPDGRIDR